MQIKPCNCPGAGSNFRGLADVNPFGIVGSALNLFAQQGGGGGGAAAAGGAGVNVKTTVATEVSPNISPVFVQQQSPSNSPVNATTSTPITGAIPGFDYASGYAPTGTPTPIVTSAGLGVSSQTLTLAGIALLAFALVRRGSRKGRRA